jgi:23S rRNA (guanosine2251-2'-O)-methyltransferase
VTLDVVYGRQPVREVLRGRRNAQEILVSARARSSLGWLAEAGVPVREVERDRLDEIAGSDDHQGVVARVDPFAYTDAEALVEAEIPLIVALDGVTDPRNLGAVIRTAECAGASGVVVPRHRSAVVTPAVAKASAGAVEHLPVAVVSNLADWLERIKRPGLWSYAATADASLIYTAADFSDGAVLVLGAEGSGIRPRVARACDAAVALPLVGRIGSLNVAVAAGILLYEAVRQRG